MPKINGIAWDEDSKYYKELKRWDTPKRDGGMKNDGFEKYPQMLYMAQRHPLGNKYEVAAKEDVLSLDQKTVIFSAEQFNRSCQMTVADEREYDRAYQAGWRPSQAEAMEYQEKLADFVAQAAAHRAHEDRNMSEKAQAEARKADDATPQHVIEVPEAPRVKRKYTRKAKTEAQA